MNYADMTDFEINKAVALANGYDTNVKQHFGEAGLATVKTTEGSFNFCSSWADAGPIIEEYGISIERVDGNINAMVEDAEVCGFWYSCGPMEYGYGNVEPIVPLPPSKSRSPLRAAMIVFLMMQEEKCSN